GVVPDQVPTLSVRTEPTWGVPLIVGADVFAGALPRMRTVRVSGERALSAPKSFRATTSTRTRLPTSADVSLYELCVSPEMSKQSWPGGHRCHWIVNEIGCAPVQLPTL